MGVAKVRTRDDATRGVHSKVFDYLMKNIAGINKWDDRLANKIQRVKQLKIPNDSP